MNCRRLSKKTLPFDFTSTKSLCLSQ